MSAQRSVLFDAQGPRARRITLGFNVLGLVLAAGICWWILAGLAAKGQLDAEHWDFLFTSRAWRNFFLPGLESTLKAAGLAIVTSVVFGLVFGMGRLSGLAPVRWVCTVIVEFFRAVPVLLMMIFFYLWLGGLGVVSPRQLPLYAVVLGLTLYNGSVIAELVRSGVQQLPRGQGEAGLALDLSRAQVLRIVQLPQALVAMLPSLLSQFVVILKDTALGYIITYPELLAAARRLGSAHSMLQALLMAAALFIVINVLLTALAGWVSRWLSSRTSGRTRPDATAAVDPV